MHHLKVISAGAFLRECYQTNDWLQFMREDYSCTNIHQFLQTYTHMLSEL